MSKGNIDILMQLIAAWEASRSDDSEPEAPFNDGKHMLNAIDSIPLGDVPWEAFKVTYNGDIPLNGAPSWMKKEYEVWYRNPLHVMENQIGNPDFANEQDYAPKQIIGQNNKRQYTDFMSAQWAWDQAVCLKLLVSQIYLIFDSTRSGLRVSIRRRMEPHLLQSFWVAIRQLSQLLPVKMIIIHFMHHPGHYKIMFDALIEMGCRLLAFSPFQKVSCKLICLFR
jgi:hypothetical protein